MPADAVSLELPKNLYVESTNRCNLKCKTCIQYRGNWEPQRDLSLAELVMITDQLPELEWTALHGIGEPLLNPALPDMIRHLKNRQVVVCLNSNGILLDEIHQNALIDAGLEAASRLVEMELEESSRLIDEKVEPSSRLIDGEIKP